MELLNYFRANLLQATSLTCVLGFLLGVLNVHFSDRSNYCVMTYMYEYPQFVRIHFHDNIRFPAYGLYAYSEGRWTEKARKVRFDGVPVLFLPGNAGSHMQVRSLASVALRKALSKGYDFHFDFFTISYDEELTGLFGGTLREQVEFAAKSVNKILSLYTANKITKKVPTQVIIIGHSMGGVVASRLLAYEDTLFNTKVAISLAAPLKAPVIIFDKGQDSFYRDMQKDWNININSQKPMRDNKVLISFGNGPRDLLVPSGLTSDSNCYISGLTTAVPGAWVSPDHVSIVWCKQIVMIINRFLFSMVDPETLQVIDDIGYIKQQAKHYFVANRATTLKPSRFLNNYTMFADAFWFEDSRRIYQVSRPDIEVPTYVMIRLVAFPQNRFVAIESVNLEEYEWVFGCNAKHTYNMHRYCKHASSLVRLSRWTGSANNFGKRKLATINLHNLMRQHPDWTHVIVKVPPMKKPIVITVDVNDYYSRRIEVIPPSFYFSFGKKRTVIQQTEQDSLYYELIMKEFSTLPEAYLLYVEPTMTCPEYHVSAELHVPWSKNNEYFHYFTHSKRSPMKLRLFESNPNITKGEKLLKHVKITLLMDPRCTFTVSLSTSWYHSLAQLVRNFTPLLIPYMAGLVIIAASCNVFFLYDMGSCVSIHHALNCEFMKPYYVMMLATFLFIGIFHTPYLWFLLDYSSYANNELQWVIRSLLLFPTYMVALGILNIVMVGVLCAMAFSSQLDRVILRILWGQGTTLSERLTYFARKMPMVISTLMLATVPVSCGAASLAIGAAFYTYMISRMFQDYFEDLIYKLAAKLASKICSLVKMKPKDETKWRNLNELEKEGAKIPLKTYYPSTRRDEDLNNLNFHMMLFTLWMVATLLNMPTLLAWARHFKYEAKLNTDPSFHTGLLLSICSAYIWQLDGPRKYLNNYIRLSIFIYIIGVFVMVLAPFSLIVANYAVTLVFCSITLQQFFDSEYTTIDKATFDDLNVLNKTEHEENEQNVTDRRNKQDLRKRTNYRARARNWNYFGQLTSGAKQSVENMMNISGNTKPKELNDTSDDKINTSDQNSDKDTNCKEGKNNNKDGKSKNGEETSKNDEGTIENDAGTNENYEGSNENDEGTRKDGEGTIQNEEGTSKNVDETNDCEDNTSNSEESKDSKANDNKGEETERIGANNSTGSSDVCDENKIYTVFKNLREKLSFNE